MHDTTSWRSCPCDDCRARLRAYNRDYMRDLRRDQTPRLVDAAPVRAHLLALRADGWRLQDIAETSGYHRGTLDSISSGRVHRVRTVTAEDIMSIPVRSAAA